MIVGFLGKADKSWPGVGGRSNCSRGIMDTEFPCEFMGKFWRRVVVMLVQ